MKIVQKSPDATLNEPVLTKWGSRLGLFLECDQKRDQAKSKALEIYFRKFCLTSNTRNFNLDFYLRNSFGCP